MSTEREAILKSLEPMFEKARAEGLIFHCTSGIADAPDFTPDEIDARHKKGSYIWGAVNWELVEPELEKDARDNIEDDYNPAFPCEGSRGMTIRQWYKGQALKRHDEMFEHVEDLAKHCARIADAQIREDEEHAMKEDDLVWITREEIKRFSDLNQENPAMKDEIKKLETDNADLDEQLKSIQELLRGDYPGKKDKNQEHAKKGG